MEAYWLGRQWVRSGSRLGHYLNWPKRVYHWRHHSQYSATPASLASASCQSSPLICLLILSLWGGDYNWLQLLLCQIWLWELLWWCLSLFPWVTKSAIENDECDRKFCVDLDWSNILHVLLLIRKIANDKAEKWSWTKTTSDKREKQSSISRKVMHLGTLE